MFTKDVRNNIALILLGQLYKVIISHSLQIPRICMTNEMNQTFFKTTQQNAPLHICLHKTCFLSCSL